MRITTESSALIALLTAAVASPGCVLVADFGGFREGQEDGGGGSMDASSEEDAGARRDAGRDGGGGGVDTGTGGEDAGEAPDASTSEDAGGLTDAAGFDDAGALDDAGSPGTDACIVAAERCNTRDDDCDGDTDEDPVDCVDALNATATCSGGSCMQACDTDFQDCTAAPGCESSLSSFARCGGCGSSCASREICLNEVCEAYAVTRGWFVEHATTGANIEVDMTTDGRGYTYLLLRIGRSTSTSTPSVRVVSSAGASRTFTWPTGATFHSVIVALAPDGTIAWDVRARNSAGSAVIQDLVAANAAGDTYFAVSYAGTVDIVDSAGTSRTRTASSGTDTLLVALAPSGTERWRATIGGNGSQVASVLTAIPGADPFVAGTFTTEVTLAGVVRHTAASGMFIVRFSASSGFALDSAVLGPGLYPASIAHDPVGNVYLASRVEGSVDVDGDVYTTDAFLPLIVAYDVDLNVRWSRIFDDTTGYGEEGGVDLAAGDGVVYLHGALTAALTVGSFTVGPGAFIVRLGADGTPQGAWTLDNNPYDYGGISVDADGNVWDASTMDSSLPGPNLGGGAHVSNGTSDVLLASYAPDGAYRTSLHFGGIDTDGAEDVAVHTSGRVVLLGAHRGSAMFGSVSHTASNPNGDYFLLELEP